MKFTYLTVNQLSEIPKTPGVYSFWAGKDLLYIGKANNLRNRVGTHFNQPSYRDNLFMDQVQKIGYMETESEIEALLLESAFIKEKLPKYNVMWKDGKQYFFVAITAEQLPRVFITHQPQADSQKSQFPISNFQSNPKSKNQKTKTVYIGPFIDGKAIKRTLRSLRKAFPYYTKKHDKKLCQYCNLGLCPGPQPDVQKYKKDIKNLTAVLQGKKTSVVNKLQKEMQKASKTQQYEQAKTLRDQIQDLDIIFSHAHIFRPAEDKQPIDWAAIETYLQKVLRTKRNISRVEAYDISNTQGHESTSSMPVFVNGIPAKEQYRKFKIHITGTPNDFAMLQETISRRLRHTEWQYPDLMIIDGGKGQLSSVVKAIESFDTKEAKQILVASIAKRNNELFLPGTSEPFLLRDMPQQVSNFILHIRDEAHRFAISYHRLLRKKKLQDDKKFTEGVGEIGYLPTASEASVRNRGSLRSEKT